MSDRFEQIKAKYIATFKKKKADLNLAWGNKDIPQLHELLHKLAGSSGGYGFDQLSTICKKTMDLTDQNVSKNNMDIEKNLGNIFYILDNPNS